MTSFFRTSRLPHPCPPSFCTTIHWSSWVPSGIRKPGIENRQAYLGRLADLGVRRTASDLSPLRGELEGIFDWGLPSVGGQGAGLRPGSPKAVQPAGL